MLPVSVNADTDGDRNNNSLTADSSVFNYSSAIYAEMGLDADTEVNEGDYLAFYSGNDLQGAASEGYARVTEVTVNGSDITVAYVPATEEEVNASMDIYGTRNEEIDISDEDRQKYAEEIRQQAIDSGFIDEATEYLVALAIETDGFKEMSDDLDFDLESYNIRYIDGAQPSDLENLELMGVTAELDKDETEVTVNFDTGKKLDHFKDKKGIRVELGMKTVVKIKSDKIKTGHLELELGACFVEEVMLEFNVDGGAVWKTKWIIPYIADYQATANVDLGTFTNVGITATLKTVADDDDDDDDDKQDDNKDDKKDDKKEKVTGKKWNAVNTKKVADSIADIGKQMTDLAAESGFMGGLLDDDEDDGDGDDDENEGNFLAKKYAEFIKDSGDSWITIAEQKLLEIETGIDPFHILAVSISLKFVVKANLYITIGANFETAEAKRYTFNIKVKAKEVTSSQTDLEKSNLKFEFYVFGTAGIKVGLELELAVGLFSTKLDSVGIGAEVGVYAQLWGYFYFKYAQWINSEGKKETEKYCSGALYFEIGIYLEIKFKAQLFSSDKLKYEPTLYEAQWPIFTVGDQRNVTDFADSPGAAKYKQPIEIIGKNSERVSNSLFDMNYLDLRDGSTGYVSYNDATESSFDISFTNKKFSYDPKSNTISVNAGGSSIQEETDMRIVWKGNALAFSTRTLEKTVKIIWSDPANARMIFFDSMGGNSIKTIALAVGEPVTVPTDPIKQGYIFGGWYTDESFSRKFVFPSKMPNYENKSVTAYAKWIPRKDTPYAVEHYIQNASGRYVIDSIDYRTGETDSVPVLENLVRKSADISYYDSAIYPISPDGQSIIRIYYKTNKYDVTFTYGNLEIRNENEIDEGTMPLKYTVCHGSLQYAPPICMPGYTFMGYKDVATGKPLETDKDGYFIVTASGTYAAEWKQAENTPYMIEFYVKNPVTYDDELAEKLYFEGRTGSTISADVTDYPSKYSDQKYFSYSGMSGNIDYENPVISAYGDTVICFYYNKATYDVTYMINAQEEYKKYRMREWGTMLPEPDDPVNTDSDYLFGGWYSDSSCSAESLVNFNTLTMPAENITLYAKWVPRDDIKYTVEHYLQNADNDGYTLDRQDNFTGTTGTTVFADYLDYEHYKANKNAPDTVSSATIAGNRENVLKLYYDRETVKVKLKAGTGYYNQDPYYGYFDKEGEKPAEVELSFKYGQMFQTSMIPKLELFAFNGWKDAQGNDFANGTRVEQNGIELTADWLFSAIEFTVNHYVMDTNGNYPEIPTITETKTVPKADYYTLEAFKNSNLINEGIEYKGQKNTGNSWIIAMLIDSGTEVNLYYERNRYPLTYVFGENNEYGYLFTDYTNGYVYYGADITKPDINKIQGMTASSVQTNVGIDFNDLKNMPALAITITISYTYNHYTVYFSNDQKSQEFVVGTKQELAANEFTNEGYVFMGWTDREGSSTVKYQDKQMIDQALTYEADGSVYLYPVWRPITIDYEFKVVAYKDNNLWYIPEDYVSDMSVFKKKSYTYHTDQEGNPCDDLLEVPDLANLSVAGYKFKGWCIGDIYAESTNAGWSYDDSTLGPDCYVSYDGLTDNTTRYISAVFEPAEYGIKLVNTAPETITVSDNQEKIDITFIRDGLLESPSVDPGYYETIAKKYQFEGWYTKQNGQGYKLVDGYLKMGGNNYNPADFPKNLTIENGCITFYANWVECGDIVYKVTVYPVGNVIDNAGENGFDYSTYEYTTTAVYSKYGTAIVIPEDILTAPEKLGDLKGWAVYDGNSQPVLDQNGKQMYWGGTSGFKDLLIDGTYRNISLYPDVDCNLWVFGKRVNTIEAMTMNYAPNTDGKATFDFKTTALELDNCKFDCNITSTDLGAVTKGSNNVYSLITSDMDGSLTIQVKNTNTINMTVGNDSYDFAAIAVNKSQLNILNSDEGQTHELIINSNRNLPPPAWVGGGYKGCFIYGIYVSRGYFQDMDLVYINITGDGGGYAGINAGADSTVNTGKLFIAVPYFYDVANSQLLSIAFRGPMLDNGEMLNSLYINKSSCKLALFGRVCSTAYVIGNDYQNETTNFEEYSNKTRANSALYYALHFTNTDAEWSDIQNRITEIKATVPKYWL